MLAYNCSPSFNWKKKLDDAAIARFQPALAEMGYKFQFITPRRLPCLEPGRACSRLARAYKDAGMTAYSRLQEKEFSRRWPRSRSPPAVKHQRFVGTGYFDEGGTGGGRRRCVALCPGDIPPRLSSSPK